MNSPLDMPVVPAEASTSFADIGQAVLTTPAAETLLDSIHTRLAESLSTAGLALGAGAGRLTLLDDGMRVEREVLLTASRMDAELYVVTLQLSARHLLGICMLQVKVIVHRAETAALVVTCDAALRSWGICTGPGLPGVAEHLQQAVRDLAGNPDTWDGEHFTTMTNVLRSATL